MGLSAAPVTMSLPELSYTIWFSQRVGSTWFSEALASSGIAGRPAEYLNFARTDDALKHYAVSSAIELLHRIYALGTTANGVFGIKMGYSEHRFNGILDLIGGPTDGGPVPRLQRWETAFPNHRHIFMTRRNKVRLAVSWWRAIKSGEWHRRSGRRAELPDIVGDYDAAAIDTLMQQAVVREAGLQELFTEAGVVPLEIGYEDAVQDLLGSINRVLAHLGLPPQSAISPDVDIQKTADDLNEEWVQRFRHDRQEGWENRAW